MSDPSISDIAAQLNRRIADLARELLGQPNRALSTRHQLRYGSKGSIASRLAVPRPGGGSTTSTVSAVTAWL